MHMILLFRVGDQSNDNLMWSILLWLITCLISNWLTSPFFTYLPGNLLYLVHVKVTVKKPDVAVYIFKFQ